MVTLDSAAPASRAGIWRNRNFVILVSGQFVSQAGNTLFTMAVYWFVLSTTGSRSDLGFVGSVLSLAGLGGLVAGALVDRWNRRRTMIWTDVTRSALALALTVVAAAHGVPLPLLVAVVFAMGLVGQLFGPAEMALIPTVVPDAQLMAANSVNQGGTAIAQLFGASLGGVILGVFGPVILFGFNGVALAVSVASLLLLRLPAAAQVGAGADAGPGVAARRLLTDIVQGQKAIWGSPFLRRGVPITLIVNFALSPITFLDVAWVRQVLHLGAAVYGLFGVAILVGILIGSVLAGSLGDRPSLPPILLSCFGAAGLAIAALSRVPVAVPDLAFLAVFGLSVGILNTVLQSALQRAVPDRLRGRVFGTLTAFGTMAYPLGGLLTGLAAAVTSVGNIFLGAGVLLAAASLLVLGLPSRISIDDTVEVA